MQYAIMTGTSKGLGFEAARLLLQAGVHVIGIARHENDVLTKVASEHGVNYVHYNCDLNDMACFKKTITMIDEHVFRQPISALYVINNAATIQPIERAHKIDSDALMYHYQVNVVAPMTLINHYLRTASHENVPLYGVTITSGAAERPIYGWSAYCSSKASINMYTKTVALEQTSLKTNNKVIAFSPGVMDTDMQAAIRETDIEAFQEINTFRNYKENNQLRAPETVASVLIDILKHPETMETGKIYNIHDYM